MGRGVAGAQAWREMRKVIDIEQYWSITRKRVGLSMNYEKRGSICALNHVESQHNTVLDCSDDDGRISTHCESPKTESQLH